MSTKNWFVYDCIGIKFREFNKEFNTQKEATKYSDFLINKYISFGYKDYIDRIFVGMVTHRAVKYGDEYKIEEVK